MTFPSYWECHHPNWRTPSFFRGVGQPHVELPWGFEVQISRGAWNVLLISCCFALYQCLISYVLSSFISYPCPCINPQKDGIVNSYEKGCTLCCLFPFSGVAKDSMYTLGSFWFTNLTVDNDNYLRRLVSSSVFYCQAMIVYRIVCGQCPGWFVWSPEHFVVLYVHVITRLFLILIHVSIYARAENTTRECIWKPLKLQSQVLEDVGLTSGKWTFAILPGLIRLNETCGAGGARATMMLTLKGIQLDVRPIENDRFFDNSGFLWTCSWISGKLSRFYMGPVNCFNFISPSKSRDIQHIS